ncbi:MAG: DUF4236 domain-containing protein [Deltaproteobacteria bacterium]|nr:DUF4236 domain-containing protein [Deltaproteobacteria bacterium]
MRFRKSFKLLPGVKINITSRGISSLSLGRRGATVNIGRSGTYLNVGLPGTGISHREKLFGSGRPRAGAPRTSRSPRTKDGLTAAERKATELSLLNHEADFQNSVFAEAINQHQKVKDPGAVVNEFLNPPGAITPLSGGLIFGVSVFAALTFFWPYFGVLALILGLALVKKIMVQRKETKAHNLILQERRDLFNAANAGLDDAAREKVLSIALDNLDFFFATTFSFNINRHDNSIYMDVDLPEIEFMPQSVKIVRKTRMAVEERPKREDEIRQDYARHVHGLALRIASVVFATLPSISKVVVSGYTQRLNPATGGFNDDYVLSVEFPKNEFGGLDIAHVDPIACIASFPHRRDLTRNGLMGTIIPF